MTEQAQILQRLDTIARYTLLGAKRTLNLDDVCALTSLSKSRVYALCSSNDIPHYKRAKLLYFDRDEIDNWMKSNKVLTTDEQNAAAARYDLNKTATTATKKKATRTSPKTKRAATK